MTTALDDTLIEHVKLATEGLRSLPEPSVRADVIQTAGERLLERQVTSEDLLDLAQEFQALALEFLRRGATAKTKEPT